MTGLSVWNFVHVVAPESGGAVSWGIGTASGHHKRGRDTPVGNLLGGASAALEPGAFPSCWLFVSFAPPLHITWYYSRPRADGKPIGRMNERFEVGLVVAAGTFAPLIKN